MEAENKLACETTHSMTESIGEKQHTVRYERTNIRERAQSALKLPLKPPIMRCSSGFSPDAGSEVVLRGQGQEPDDST